MNVRTNKSCHFSTSRSKEHQSFAIDLCCFVYNRTAPFRFVMNSMMLCVFAWKGTTCIRLNNSCICKALRGINWFCVLNHPKLMPKIFASLTVVLHESHRAGNVMRLATYFWAKQRILRLLPTAV